MSQQPQYSSGNRYAYPATGAAAPPTQAYQQPTYQQQPQQAYQQQPQAYGQQPQQQSRPAPQPSYQQADIKHHRRAPPPPANFVPPTGQPVQQQPPRPQQPSQPARPAAQPAYGSQGSYASPTYARQQSGAQPSYGQAPQQPARAQAPSPQQQRAAQPVAQPYPVAGQPQQQPPQQPARPQAPPSGEQPQTWIGTVTESVSSWLGRDKNQQNRNDLMAGATRQPGYTTSTQPANNSTWEQVQSNPEARQQQYAALKLDTSATDLALRKAREAQELGIATLDSLGRQAEMIDNVETNVETIHLQLDRGDRQMRAIGGMTGSISNFVTTDKAEKQNKTVYNMAHHKTDRSLNVDLQQGGGQQGGEAYGSQHMQSAPVTLKDQIKQQDAALDDLSQMLGNLQAIAGTAGKELDRQNQQLGVVNVRTQHAMQRTHDTNYRLQRLM